MMENEVQKALHSGVCVMLTVEEDSRLRQEFNSLSIEHKLRSDEFHQRWQELMNEKYANFPPIQVDIINKVMGNEQNNEKEDEK